MGVTRAGRVGVGRMPPGHPAGNVFHGEVGTAETIALTLMVYYNAKANYITSAWDIAQVACVLRSACPLFPCCGGGRDGECETAMPGDDIAPRPWKGRGAES